VFCRYLRFDTSVAVHSRHSPRSICRRGEVRRTTVDIASHPIASHGYIIIMSLCPMLLPRQLGLVFMPLALDLAQSAKIGEGQRRLRIAVGAEDLHVRHLRPRRLLCEVGHPQRGIGIGSTGGVEGEESFGEVECRWREPSVGKGRGLERRKSIREERGTHLEKVSRSLLSMAA